MTGRMQSPLPRRLNTVAYAPAMMIPGERLLLYALVFGLRPEHVLEIGTSHGGSAEIITAALDDAGCGRLVSIDPCPDLWVEWKSLGPRATLLTGASPAILQKAHEVAGGPFDFCLIDAQHTFEAVQADVLGVLPFMAANGHLLFHDAHHPPVRDAIESVLGTLPRLRDCGMLSRFVTEEEGCQWGGLRLVALQPEQSRAEPRPALVLKTADPALPVANERILSLAPQESWCYSNITAYAELPSLAVQTSES